MSRRDRLPIGMYSFDCRDAAALADTFRIFAPRPQ
jgi:hypothetical protein